MTAAPTATQTTDEALWLSYSQLTTHRRCPAAWRYKYIEHLEKVDPTDIPVERDFGTWWHALRAADSLERGRRHGSLQASPRTIKTVDGGPVIPVDQADVAAVVYAAEHWWQSLSPPIQEVWTDRLGAELTPRLLYAYDRWREEYEEEIATEHPLAVELGWGRDMPGPTRVRLVGYVDEVYLDTKRNMVVVRDHKTSKALATQTVADDMMDSQLQLYAWGATPAVRDWAVGPIRATAYDRMRSTAPRPPQLTLGGRLAMRGGEPSIGSSDLHTYVTWARGEDGLGVPYPGTKKDGSGAGMYQLEQSVVERLSAPSARSAWFQRTLTPLNANLIRAHLRAAIDSATDLAATRHRSLATGEAARNLTSNCRYCDFVKLCRVQMVGGADGDFELADYSLRRR